MCCRGVGRRLVVDCGGVVVVVVLEMEGDDDDDDDDAKLNSSFSEAEKGALKEEGVIFF